MTNKSTRLQRRITSATTCPLAAESPCRPTPRSPSSSASGDGEFQRLPATVERRARPVGALAAQPNNARSRFGPVATGTGRPTVRYPPSLPRAGSELPLEPLPDRLRDAQALPLVRRHPNRLKCRSAGALCAYTQRPAPGLCRSGCGPANASGLASLGKRIEPSRRLAPDTADTPGRCPGQRTPGRRYL